MDPGLEYALDQIVRYLDKSVEDQSASVAAVFDQIGERGKSSCSFGRRARSGSGDVACGSDWIHR